MAKKKRSDEIKSAMRAESSGAWRLDDGVSTGSTLLNLALTGRPDVGLLRGSYVLFVGDTESGKSFVCRTCFAEASINPKFDDYRLVSIDKERGALMDHARFFGERCAKRIETIICEDVEDLYDLLDDLLDDGYRERDDAKRKKKADAYRPFIAVVDSIDALGSRYAEAKFQEGKTARRKGVKPKGDYGDAKAAIHSRNIRRVLSGLERTGSIIIFINQTRDNVDAGLFEAKSTHSGGKAISFYATMKLWSRRGGELARTYKGKRRQLGIVSHIDVKRTRVTGRHRSVDIPIYHSVGIDDIGGCVDWLVSEPDVSGWRSPKGATTIETPDFRDDAGKPLKLSREKLVAWIEENGKEDALRELVVDAWDAIEVACRVKRKRRYG